MDRDAIPTRSRAYQRNEYGQDATNPKHWSSARKFVSTAIICIIGFVTTMGASIYAPGHENVKAEFRVSTTVSLLPISSYSLGLAFGPMISSPLSETFGRKVVYLATLPLFDIFLLGCGFSRSIESLIVCRFFAGLFAAPGVSVAAATITDYTVPEARAAALASYYTVPFIGSAVGPLIGGFTVAAKGWRWTAWVTLIMAAVSHPPALFLRESYRPILLQRKATEAGGNQQTVLPELTETLKKFVTTTVIRPLHMLFTEPLVGFICLYTGFQFALLYTFVVASPWVFETIYGFSVQAQGLSFLGLVAGCVLAPFVLIFVNHYMVQHWQRQHNRTLETKATSQQRTAPSSRTQLRPLPEHKLYPAMYGSLILPIGLFMFAWTARPTIHWMVPILSQAITLLGSVLIYVPCNAYMLEVYGAKYGASASGASSLSRYTLSAAFPLFVIQMYEALGVQWATSLLGFVALSMAGIPWCFFRQGEKFREKSGYEHGQ